MSEKTDAWMPLWIGAYLADTQTLTTTQHGAYLLLLMAYWRARAPLLDDDEALRSVVKADRAEWRKLRLAVVRFFKVADGVWWHKRVEAEIADAEKRKAGAVGKAQAAAKARWKQPNADAPSIPQALPEDCPTPSPIPSPSEKEKPPPSSEVAVSRQSAHPPSPPPAFDGTNAEALNGKSVVTLATAWELPMPWGEDAEALGFKTPEVLREAERFRQYWVSGKGMGKRRSVKGWRQSWSNWLGNAERDLR